MELDTRVAALVISTMTKAKLFPDETLIHIAIYHNIAT